MSKRMERIKYQGAISIGKYTLWDSLDGEKISIAHESGEGGAFDVQKLEKVIDKVFKKHF